MALTRDVAGGFAVTPFARSDALSDALGADVWVKDETGNVGGSHKARHLFDDPAAPARRRVARAAPSGRGRPLAIASCGNAAIAAATLAAAGGLADRRVRARLGRRRRCSALLDVAGRVDHPLRRGAPTTRPGDPAVLRFREAVAAGADPVQRAGPRERAVPRRRPHDRLGAAPTPAVGARPGVRPGRRRRVRGVHRVGARRPASASTPSRPRAARRWPGRGGGSPTPASRRRASRPHWAELMTPWDDPHSAADGILDDETYDWLGVFEVDAALRRAPVVVPGGGDRRRPRAGRRDRHPGQPHRHAPASPACSSPTAPRRPASGSAVDLLRRRPVRRPAPAADSGAVRR